MSKINLTNIIICKFYNNIEYLILCLVLLIFSVFYYFKYFSYIFMILGLTIGTFLFILFNKLRYNLGEDRINDRLHHKIEINRLEILLNLLFVIIYGLSIVYLLQVPYSKTVLYYFFISLCAGIIFFEILIMKDHIKKMTNLLKTYLLGLNVFLSNQILFPYGIGGSDIDYHLPKLILPIIGTGHIPLGIQYSYFPGHHLLVSISSIILDTDPEKLYFILGGMVMSLGIPLSYILGYKFFDYRIGLLAGLLYPFNDFIILWASHPAQLTYSVPIIIILFLVINIWLQNRKTEFLLLIEILMLTLIFTHHYSSFIFLFLILSILISEIIEPKRKSRKNLYSGKLFILFIIMLFVQWIYYSYLFKTFLDLFQTYGSILVKIERTSPISYDTLPLKTIFLNTLGTSITLSLSIIGFLYFLKESRRKFFKTINISFVIIGVILIGIGITANTPYLLPQRLFVFVYIFGALFLLSYVFQRAMTHHIILGTMLIMVIAFFSASSTISGFETSLFLNNQAYVKLFTTPQEINSGKWLKHHEIGDKNIYKTSMTDYKSYTNKSFINLPIRYNLSNKKYMLNIENITNNSYIIYSKFDSISGFFEKYGVGMGRGKIEKFTPDFESEINNIFNKNYYDGIISIYQIRKVFG